MWGPRKAGEVLLAIVLVGQLVACAEPASVTPERIGEAVKPLGLEAISCTEAGLAPNGDLDAYTCWRLEESTEGLKATVAEVASQLQAGGLADEAVRSDCLLFGGGAPDTEGSCTWVFAGQNGAERVTNLFGIVFPTPEQIDILMSEGTFPAGVEVLFRVKVAVVTTFAPGAWQEEPVDGTARLTLEEGGTGQAVDLPLWLGEPTACRPDEATSYTGSVTWVYDPDEETVTLGIAQFGFSGILEPGIEGGADWGELWWMTCPPPSDYGVEGIRVLIREN